MPTISGDPRLPSAITLTLGAARHPTLYPPHEPCPTEAQSGSHESKEKEIEHVWTAESLAQAIPQQ